MGRPRWGGRVEGPLKVMATVKVGETNGGKDGDGRVGGADP